MRYLRKQKPPGCFTEFASQASNDTPWSEFQNPCKGETRDVILEREQQFLCVYCERGIEQPTNCHLEHMEPQSHPGCRFEYANIVVSCNGGDCLRKVDGPYAGLDIESCGHRKDDSFDRHRFLDPTKVENIGEYFEYDRETGTINASMLDPERANYMIHELLHLDNPFLNNSRWKARQALENAVRQRVRLKKTTSKMSLVRQLLERDPPFPFISFLRSCYPVPKES